MTIVHTSDLGEVATELVGTRPKVFPHLAGAVRALQPDVLTDGGDTLPVIAEGDPGWAWLADMAYGAWVPGNHDLDWPADNVRRALSRTGVPAVAANLHAGTWSATPVRTVLGGRVGVIGAARAGHDPSWVVDDPAPAVAAATATCRGQVDAVVLLSHLGADRDAEIARQTGGIDLVLSGHVHQALQEPLRVGRTPVVQVGANGRYVGLVCGVPGDWRADLVDPRGSGGSHPRRHGQDP